MRISKDGLILVITVLALGVGIYFIAVRSYTRPDSPSSYSIGKQGTKALYMLLDKLGFSVGRQTRSLHSIPRNARVMFLVNPDSVVSEDVEALTKWVRKGNTLVLAVSDTYSVAPSFGVDLRSIEFSSESTVRPLRGAYSVGVRNVLVQPLAYVKGDTDFSPIVRDKKGVVAAEQSLGKGRLIVCTDPLLFANSIIREEDNVVLVTNLVYRNAGKGDLVLFAEYDRILANSDRPKSPLGLPGKLVLAQITFAVVVLLLSAGHRFGGIHPLPEKEQRMRGWEFVRAVAGLYQRAEAREVALASVYRSFRRELILRFGVSPTATPAEAAEAILRSREVDRARLTALMTRCDRVAGGEKISDGEAIALCWTIEECRKELGIARTGD